MRIEDLKPSQHVPGRWLAVMDDGSLLRLGESEVLDFDLYAGRTLTDEEAEAIQAAAQKSARKEKALSYAGGKPTSRRELARKLEQWGADEAEQQAVCDRLEELGVLDDRRYGEQVVRHYSAKGYGPARLRDELYRRGVPREFWEEALVQAGDGAQAIRDFLDKKLKGRLPDDPKERRRISDALARRGFGWEEISDALRSYGLSEELEE